ncbi:hypothetical protein SUGI_0046730 [Cryptomeria japonica]|uniref:pre-mRNA-splicing factor SPP2 n=1 Tax=Cryptomeria japonica TaxID=3369 RepID=UPI002408C1D0|nr:pre-mRNA-splicing factor SPP2 [Cryptomeria japonica]GLJ06740.1 hypothetical protein SUGI_0046730 [Cryptomeria japonica]
MEEKSSSGSDTSSDSENSSPAPVKFSLHLHSKPYVKPKSYEKSEENVQYITEFDYKPQSLKTIPRLSNSRRLFMVNNSHLNAKAQSFELPTQILQDNSIMSEEGFLSKDEMEKQKLREDIELCADEASLEAYERMPVEEFGEALLRGMGWSYGKAIGLNCRDPGLPYQYPNRSVARLGFGASLPLKNST